MNDVAVKHFHPLVRAIASNFWNWLCSLSPIVMSYVGELCHKQRAEMNQQLLALELAAEQEMYGVEYVHAIVTLPAALPSNASGEADSDLATLTAPAQQEVERDLVQYEQYVTNRESVLVRGART